MADETIKDIVRDLRARADRAEAAVGFPTVESENGRRLADRIEAAAEPPSNIAAILRDMRAKEMELWERKPPRLGPGAAALMLDGFISRLEAASAKGAAPPRNCDVCGTWPEAVGAYRRRLPPRYLRKAREYDSIEDFAAWLYAKAEGGDHANAEA